MDEPTDVSKIGSVAEKTLSRRRLLLTGAIVASGTLAGCSGGGGDDADGTTVDTEEETTTDSTETTTTETGSEDTCTPGHSDGDPACQQVADDASELTEFDATETPLLVSFEYPCGWNAGTTDQFDDRYQANVTRSEIGDSGAYVDVQIRSYSDPVGAGFLETKKTEGSYEEIEFTYDGERRRGLLSSPSTAEFGTVAHTVVPHADSLYHVEFVSTMQNANCEIEPRPDYDLVKAMLKSTEPNPDSTVDTADSDSTSDIVEIPRYEFTAGESYTYDAFFRSSNGERESTETWAVTSVDGEDLTVEVSSESDGEVTSETVSGTHETIYENVDQALLINFFSVARGPLRIAQMGELTAGNTFTIQRSDFPNQDTIDWETATVEVNGDSTVNGVSCTEFVVKPDGTDEVQTACVADGYPFAISLDVQQGGQTTMKLTLTDMERP